jgi:hypothetical protein
MEAVCDAVVIMKLANDVTKLGEISKELRMKTLDVEREKAVGVVPNSLQDIGRASDGAKRRPVKAEGWAGA